MILKSSLPGPSFVDWKRTDTAHNENLNENNKTKFTEKDSRHQVGAEKKELSIEYGNWETIRLGTGMKMSTLNLSRQKSAVEAK